MKALVDRAKKGDKKAFLELIEPLEKKIYIIAKSKIDNAEDVKDVIQETLLLSFKNIKKLKDNTKFDAWIITILLNTCKKYYKSRKNIIHVPIEENSEVIDHQDDYEQLNSNIDFFKYLNLLSDDTDKEIFILFYSNDYTTRQISEILNINENTVKTKLKRSRDKVQKYIERGNNYGK